MPQTRYLVYVPESDERIHSDELIKRSEFPPEVYVFVDEKNQPHMIPTTDLPMIPVFDSRRKTEEFKIFSDFFTEKALSLQNLKSVVARSVQESLVELNPPPHDIRDCDSCFIILRNG